MDLGQDVSFRPLTLEESINKLKLAFSGAVNAKLSIWSVRDETSVSRPFVSSNLKSFICSLQGSAINIEYSKKLLPTVPFQSGEKIILTLLVGSVVYVAEGDIFEKNLDNWNVKLRCPLQRHEGRNQERLLVYPHHQGMAYLVIPKKEKKILYFNAAKKDQVTGLDQYLMNEQENLAKLLNLNVDSNSTIMELKILDISANGIAVFSNENEVKRLEEVGVFKNVVIKVNNDRAIFESLKWIYEVPYLDFKLVSQKSISWKKIGFTIPEQGMSLSVSELIGKYIGESIEKKIRNEYKKYVYEGKK